jgi:hypothetical protein
MTTLEQLQALPDDQLIEKVAVDVMGWWRRKEPLTEREIWVNAGGEHAAYRRSWNPLTDWNHTMDAVERMRARGFFWFVEDVFLGLGKDDLTRVGFVPAGASKHLSVHTTQTQRAVCLAALLAVSQ